MNNPKLEGSNIIDCIPIGGTCPNNCSPCYWNDGSFYHDINEPLIPTMEDVGDKIVRINSGKDSTVDFDAVIKLTRKYPKKFYNTSLPHRICEFPAPVVFTANPNNIQWFYAVTDPFRLMAVRLRVCSWNIKTIDSAVRHYSAMDVPVILTFLYFNNDNLDFMHYPIEKDYELKKHIEGNRFMIKEKKRASLALRYFHYPNVLTCGTYEYHLCKDCGNCSKLYQRAMSMWFSTDGD